MLQRERGALKGRMVEGRWLHGTCSIEFYKQTEQKFIRLYYLDCWIEIIQYGEQNKSSTKCIVVQIIQFYELLFCLICLG